MARFPFQIEEELRSLLLEINQVKMLSKVSISPLSPIEKYQQLPKELQQ
ncbi:MAG: hypothetical protein R3E32_21335 [Chitinophagales bacterium]